MTARRYSKQQRELLHSLMMAPRMVTDEFMFAPYCNYRTFSINEDDWPTTDELQAAKKRARNGLKVLAARGDVELYRDVHPVAYQMPPDEYPWRYRFLAGTDGSVWWARLTAQGQETAAKFEALRPPLIPASG